MKTPIYLIREDGKFATANDQAKADALVAIGYHICTEDDYTMFVRRKLYGKEKTPRKIKTFTEKEEDDSHETVW